MLPGFNYGLTEEFTLHSGRPATRILPIAKPAPHSMRTATKMALLLVVLAITTAYAGTNTGTPVCIGPAPTSHPTACERLVTTLEECNAKASKDEIKSCFCSQNIVNAMISCEEETRQCLQSTDFDSATDQAMLEWHSVCDQFISEATITTPSLTPLTTTFRLDDCFSAAQACLEREHGVSTCSSAHSADVTGFVSCVCESSQVDLASRCEIDGGRCDFIDKKGPTVTDIWEYKNCNPTGWIPATGMVNSTTASLSRKDTTTQTKPAITFPQTASSTSRSDGCRLRPTLDFLAGFVTLLSVSQQLLFWWPSCT